MPQVDRIQEIIEVADPWLLPGHAAGLLCTKKHPQSGITLALVLLCRCVWTQLEPDVDA